MNDIAAVALAVVVLATAAVVCVVSAAVLAWAARSVGARLRRAWRGAREALPDVIEYSKSLDGDVRGPFVGVRGPFVGVRDVTQCVCGRSWNGRVAVYNRAGYGYVEYTLEPRWSRYAALRDTRRFARRLDREFAHVGVISWTNDSKQQWQ